MIATRNLDPFTSINNLSHSMENKLIDMKGEKSNSELTISIMIEREHEFDKFMEKRLEYLERKAK